MQQVCPTGKWKGTPHGYSSRQCTLNLKWGTTTHPSEELAWNRLRIPSAGRMWKETLILEGILTPVSGTIILNIKICPQKGVYYSHHVNTICFGEAPFFCLIRLGLFNIYSCFPYQKSKEYIISLDIVISVMVSICFKLSH